MRRNAGMSDYLDVFKRLRRAVETTTDAGLAKALGITQASVAAAKKKHQVPPGWIMKIARDHEVSADWLLFGYGGMIRGAGQIENGAVYSPGFDKAGFAFNVLRKQSLPAKRISLSDTGFLEFARKDATTSGTKIKVVASGDTTLVSIPLIEARLGENGKTKAIQTFNVLHFRAAWLASRGDPTRMVVLQNTEEAMAPMINSGDYVLLDKSQKKLIVGGIYVIAMGQEIVIRRIEKKPGLIALKSFNAQYDPIEIADDDLKSSISIIGRVIWWCHECP